MLTGRITHLREICEINKLDAFLISTNSNIFYLTGFSAFLTTDHDGFCLVTKKNVYILTTPLYGEAVKRYSPDTILRETTHEKWYTELLQDIVKEEKIDRIGFEAHDLRYSEYHEFQGVKLHLIPATLRDLRIKKDIDEIKQIEKACLLTDETFTYIVKNIKEGITEKQTAWEMEKFIKEKGGQLAFNDTIVAFGNHSAMIHHQTTNKKLEKNEFILFDFGAKVNLYCADMSRTIFYGKPSNEQEKMYDAVKNAQQKAIDYFKDKQKVSASKVDLLSRKVIEDAGFPEYPHALGHGIGLDIHESPALSHFAKDMLEEHMVFTIEPGTYIPGLGGVRIEDMFVMEQAGIRQLTNSPKDLIVL